MSIKEMNQEVAQEWLTALESGEYKQGNGQLSTQDGRFCCLGVLCDLHAKKTGNEWVVVDPEVPTKKNYLGERNYLPLEVAKWAGFTLDGKSEFGNYLNPRTSNGVILSNMNDQGSTFTDIAALIREDVFGKEGQ